ncbi:hypothetical protein [Lichenihabitans psoromatis]|nr:hypothetical protein [Lichenihabitans psoromatis]
MTGLDLIRKALALPVRLLGWVLWLVGFTGTTLARQVASFAHWIEGKR